MPAGGVFKCALWTLLMVSFSLQSQRAASSMLSNSVASAMRRLAELAPGDYFRPSGDQVSGVPNNQAAYHRSPCPALNTLANHGHLPRDGKNLSPQIVKEALIQVYNLDNAAADTLVAALPANFTLATLGEHNFIEHDASLVHDDAYFGKDPSQINETLVTQLIARADQNGEIDKKALGKYRGDRETTCKREDPQYVFGFKQQTAAYAEAAVLLLIMGDYDRVKVSVDHAQSFLLHEKLPQDFAKPRTPVTKSTVALVAAEVKWYSYWGGGSSVKQV